MALPPLASRNPTKDDVGDYRLIKQVADVEVGIPTVCMQNSKFLSRDGQTIDNVLLKANLKLDGTSYRLGFGSSFLLEDTLVLGLDVTHPPPVSADTEKSVAGMVANVDRDLPQWPATLTVQPVSRNEIVGPDAYEELFDPHFDRWFKHVGDKVPRNILLYRDDVSEGQYDHIIFREYRYLRAACVKKYRSATRKLSYQASLSSLLTRAAIQGTVRPAHYVVVVDQIFRQPDLAASKIHNAAEVPEDLTLALCYALGRCTMAIGICAPARLADLACNRTQPYTPSGPKLYEGVKKGSRFPDPDSPKKKKEKKNNKTLEKKQLIQEESKPEEVSELQGDCLHK
ncbi:ribonuclease H-like domain-containing protein [Podospora didyma]|uniref:Ribonuclease H-like domain-containing protein n=1 Tax=Podospora didyma TaxID=330526 RepID=A0AAE0N1Z7_9PEZI|nr:ribonuclease H-like domain-containing protein [Podospora didyma]